MKKVLIIGAVILAGLTFILYCFVILDQQKLHEIVKADFIDKHPTYQFIDCVVGEGMTSPCWAQVK